MLFICSCGEFSNLKRSHLLTVCGNAILGKADETAIVVKHAAAGTGNAFVAGDDGAGRMQSPRGCEIVGGVKIE